MRGEGKRGTHSLPLSFCNLPLREIEFLAKYLSSCWLQIRNERDLFWGERIVRVRAGFRRTPRTWALQCLARVSHWTYGETEAQMGKPRHRWRNRGTDSPGLEEAVCSDFLLKPFPGLCLSLVGVYFAWTSRCLFFFSLFFLSFFKIEDKCKMGSVL